MKLRHWTTIVGSTLLFGATSMGCVTGGNPADTTQSADSGTDNTVVCCSNDGECSTAAPGACSEDTYESGFGTCEDFGCPVPGFVGLARTGIPRKVTTRLRRV